MLKKQQSILFYWAAAWILLAVAPSRLGAQGAITIGPGSNEEKERTAAAAAAAATATPRLTAAIQHGMAGVVCVKNNSILILDPNTRAVSGNLLAGELGDLFDVAITPDGRTALLSSLNSQKVFFVDISRPAAPRVLGSMNLSLYPEDIALTPDGKYALVTGPPFSSLIASIHVPTRTLVGEFSVTSGTPSAVAVARDGRTVLCASFFSSSLHVLTIDPTNGQLALRADIPATPMIMNVSISPDGRTALAIGFFGCDVLRIDAPGSVSRVGSLALPDFSWGQSAAFTPKGDRAFLVGSVSMSNEYMVWEAMIQGPGQAVSTGTVIPLTGFFGYSAYFGVETMAVEPLGRYLFVSNRGEDELNRLAVVDLASATQAESIDPASSTGSKPVGIAFAGGAADLAVSKTLDNARPFVGETITFTVTVANRGPGIAFAVEASDLLAAPLSLVSAEATAGSYDPRSGSWRIARIDPGRSATLVVKARADAAQPFRNEARVARQSNYDPQGGNDSAVVTGEAREPRPLPPAGLQLQRLENNFIFYKEYVNRLAWQANPAETSIVTHYNIYRKPRNDADTAYALLASVGAAVHAYEDKGLRADQLFTYRLTAVNTLGMESDPVVAGN